jgi:murein DD-endopeptidase MepM/ murein hydrolase activator NlpD
MATLAFVLLSHMLWAQTAYRYRDANGQWVFTDQAPASNAPADSFSLGHDKGAMHLSIIREDDAQSTRLTAVNECLCVATFQVTITHSAFNGIPEGTDYRVTLQPQSRQSVVQATRPTSGSTELQYRWRAALGSPDAMHSPAVPYRVPFGIGSTYSISQAYPSRITHLTPDSQYAVDIALPDDTPVYAAREGTVIDARQDFFRDAVAAVMLDQANMIEILHGDGTIAIYAHLHWDSVRVRIGDHVVRGQYIADSGKTGFASGPHLHFAVVRNTGVENVSIPFQFAGTGGIGVTPLTNMPLTAY